MKTHNTFKIFLAVTQLTLTSIHAAYTSSANADILFQEAIEYHEHHKEPSDSPKFLGILEFKLKRVIESPDVSQEVLSECAKILLSIGCKESYDKAFSRIHLPTYSEFCYNEALHIHTTNAQPHTPQILTEIEWLLTRIKDDQKASAINLYYAAYLAFCLDLRSLYIQLVNIIFYRKDFDSKKYKSFIQKIRLLKNQ